MTMAAEERERALARVGSVLKDKWRLDALLGVGGMAAVYAATHRNNKRVAIKMLLPEIAHDVQVRERFVREGYAANTIEHPGALSVLDDDVSEEGLPYLVMELLDGETVEARWERAGRKMALPDVLSIAAHVLDVLVAAHAKGIVHRDIKPENLFLPRGGGIKVLDFGIARVREQQQGTRTRVGTVMGTPAFMAPEQALAKWDEVDGRTDLWAVGATMFTLVSGQHVHEGITGNEQLIKSATQPARSIATVASGVPRSVIALIDRALKFDRTARWPDAQAMQDAACGAYEAITGETLIIETPSMAAPSTWSDRQPRSAPTSSGQRPMQAPPSPGPRRTTSGSMPQPTMPSGGNAARGAMSTGGTRIGMPGQQPNAMPSGQQRAAMPSGSHTAQRRASGSFDMALDPLATAPTATNLAPPAMAALSVDAFVAGRAAERDAANAEVARLSPIVTEIQGRLAGAKRRAQQVQEQIAGVRKERAADEEKFRRAMEARLEGLGEARKAYRRAMGEVARIALADVGAFPPDFGPNERAAITQTRAAADARARDSALHEAALHSYDKEALKKGLVLGIGGILLLLLLFFSPVIIRSFSSDGTGTMAPPPVTGESS